MLCIFVDMLASSIFQSVEFYVIAVVVAAAVVALLGRRPSDGPVRQYLLSGVISQEGGDEVSAPRIDLLCGEDGSVILRRHGLKGVREDGTVSLAVEVKGFDVSITERVVPGREPWQPVDTASFILDFMGREHYFISYRCELSASESALFASVTLHNRPGNRVSKYLQ